MASSDIPAYPSPAKRGLPPFQIDWCVCMPEPLSPKRGFGMKVTVLPCRFATFLQTYLKYISLSAMDTRESYRMSISACPAVATSWCCFSM